MKNSDQKCFPWCHVRPFNHVKVHQQRITQNDKKFANDLDYGGITFPVPEKDFSKTETKNNICINVYCYESTLVFLINISDQKFENSMDLLLVIDENKSHYMYIKDFDRFVFHKTKNKTFKMVIVVAKFNSFLFLSGSIVVLKTIN